MSVAVYTNLDNGTYGWTPTGRFPHFYTFLPDARFSSASDMPGGSGTYIYNGHSGDLTLNYEADRYGNMATTVTYKVEQLTDTKLIISHYSAISNFTYKTEYSKVN